MQRFLAFILSCTLAACTYVDSSSAGRVDPNDKVIAVTAGGGRLLQSVKQALREHGWKIIAAEGLHISPGGGRSFSGERGTLARYSMHLNAQSLIGIGRNWVAFDVSVVDNQSGEEIFTASSNDTLMSTATATIIKGLEGKK